MQSRDAYFRRHPVHRRDGDTGEHVDRRDAGPLTSNLDEARAFAASIDTETSRIAFPVSDADPEAA